MAFDINYDHLSGFMNIFYEYNSYYNFENYGLLLFASDIIIDRMEL